MAQYNYGHCLQTGQGIAIDLERARHYFQLAASHWTSRCSIQ
jgi:TPR repeat protein